MAFFFAFILLLNRLVAVDSQTTEINKKLLDKFNSVRKAERAADMKAMTWNSVMEALASDFVQKCNRDHPIEDIIQNKTTVGHNVFVSSILTKDETQYYLEAIDFWVAQNKSYDFHTRKCGSKCSDYLQVVWAESDSVGCAFKVCHDAAPMTGKSVVVSCFFKPGGAYPDQDPFIKSEPCGACPQSCVDGLCV